MTRTARHLVLLLAGLGTFGLFHLLYAPDDLFWWFSMSSAYASLFLLALTLAIGPWNKLRGIPNPVSTYLRRDIGIWAGIFGIFHVVFGLLVHFRGHMQLYFVPMPGTQRFPYRYDAFGLANHLGLFATVVLVLLLALSNDASMRKLGGRPWKSLQRWNYAGAILVVAHGALYQILEKRKLGLVAACVIVVGITVALQAAGFRATRKKNAARGGRPS